MELKIAHRTTAYFYERVGSFQNEICVLFLVYFHYKILCLLPARRNTKTLAESL